jgi:UDPglucose 6-dehydrogenase
MKIVITGTSGGIGHYLARHLGLAGHEIWGLALSPQKQFQQECEAQGISFRYSQANIAEWPQVSGFSREVAAAWSQLDVLICCAGVQGPLGPGMSADPLAWSTSVRTNLDGTYYTIRAFHELLLRHAIPRAKILCLSGGGSTSPRINFTPYAAAKTGLVRLVETLALEWSGGTIDINAIAPGAINTRMTEEVLNSGPSVVGEKEFAVATRQRREGGASLARVASMFELLISAAGDNLSGRLISARWDPWETLSQHRKELAETDIFTLRRIVPQDRGKDWAVTTDADREATPAAPAKPKITVLGLWHLGSVTAACCARHFSVFGLEFDSTVVANLKLGKAPLSEPGLDDLISTGLAAKQLDFTADPATACDNADVLWLCYDTPVDENDESDVEYVLANLRRALPHLPKGALVLISAQLPVGTCRRLELEYPQLHFACSPENLRLGKALASFEKAERVIVGVRNDTKKGLLEKLFAPFTPQVIFMRTESAEMVKHALNSFLALSVTFINEIARLCEQVGADAKEVSIGLKTDPRIGPNAYLGPGGPFAGGTLARDVVSLTRLGAAEGETLSIIPAIKQSNDLHRGWAFQRLQSRLGGVRGKTIAVLGLVYTPNTDTLRRSAAVELCNHLLTAGAAVRAFDPAIKQLPAELAAVSLASSVADAFRGADAAVVCTGWPQFRSLDWPAILPRMRGRVIVDANRFLEKELKDLPGVEHLSVGRTQ